MEYNDESDISLNYNLIYNDNLDISNIENIVLIEDTVGDISNLFHNLNNKSFGIIYNINSTKSELINILNNKNVSSIKRLCIVFADTNLKKKGKRFLDNNMLFLISDFNKTSMNETSENFKFLIELLQDYNIINLDFLACNTLKYDLFKNYYNKINEFSDVIIGASDDKTGNIKYGGDWVLESTNEDIQNIYFNESIINYTRTLETSVITSSVTITNDNIGDYYYPITIENDSSNTLVVTLSGDDIYIPTRDPSGVVYPGGFFYFIINSDNIEFNGNNCNLHYTPHQENWKPHKFIAPLFYNGSLITTDLTSLDIDNPSTEDLSNISLFSGYGNIYIHDYTHTFHNCIYGIQVSSGVIGNPGFGSFVNTGDITIKNITIDNQNQAGNGSTYFGSNVNGSGIFFGHNFCQYFGFNNNENTYNIIVEYIKTSKNSTSYPAQSSRWSSFMFGPNIARYFINGNLFIRNNEMYGRLDQKDTKGMLSGLNSFVNCISGNVYIENNIFDIKKASTTNICGVFNTGLYRNKEDFQLYYRNNILKIPYNNYTVNTFHNLGSSNGSDSQNLIFNPNKKTQGYFYNNYIIRQGDPNGNKYMTSNFYNLSNTSLYDKSVEFNNIYNIGPDSSYGDWNDISASFALYNTRTNYENFEITYDNGTNTRDLSINIILPGLSQINRWVSSNNNIQWTISNESVPVTTDFTIFSLYDLFSFNYSTYKNKLVNVEDISTNLNIDSFEVLHENTIDYSFELLDISSSDIKTFKYNNSNNYIYSYFKILIKNGDTIISDVSNTIHYKLKFSNDVSLNTLYYFNVSNNNVLVQDNDISYTLEYSDISNYIIQNSLTKSGIYMNISENYDYTVSYEENDIVLLNSLDNKQYILDTNFVDISTSILISNPEEYDTYSISMEKHYFENLLLFNFNTISGEIYSEINYYIDIDSFYLFNYMENFTDISDNILLNISNIKKIGNNEYKIGSGLVSNSIIIPNMINIMNYLIHKNILNDINNIDTSDSNNTNNISKVEYLFKSVINKSGSTNRINSLFNSIKNNYIKNPSQYYNFDFDNGDTLKFYINLNNTNNTNNTKKAELNINLIDNNYSDILYKYLNNTIEITTTTINSKEYFVLNNEIIDSNTRNIYLLENQTYTIIYDNSVNPITLINKNKSDNIDLSGGTVISDKILLYDYNYRYGTFELIVSGNFINVDLYMKDKGYLENGHGIFKWNNI